MEIDPCNLLLQLSFQMWTDQMQESLNSKKKGDMAFRHKDFKDAIECYSQVVSFAHFRSMIIYFIFFVKIATLNVSKMSKIPFGTTKETFGKECA